MDSASAYSTFHSSSSDPILNLTADGYPLKFRSALRGPEAKLWEAFNGEEIGRLIDSKTLVAIHLRDQPVA